MRRQHKAWFDGGSTPNPGIMKIGGYIQNPSAEEIFRYSKTLGHGTNNEAEYKSLIFLLQEIVTRDINKVSIFGDSQLVVNQVTGVFKTRDYRMKKMRREVRTLLQKIDRWNLHHIPRAKNKKADSLT
jgi:ribonuclease HI